MIDRAVVVALLVFCLVAQASLLGSAQDSGAAQQIGTLSEPGGILVTSSILPEYEDGALATFVRASLHPRPAAADFNGDGVTDICLPQITAPSGSGIRTPFVIAWGSEMDAPHSWGVGSFLELSSLAIPGLVAYGDFNEDGCADIATCLDTSGGEEEAESARVLLWLGSREDGFTESIGAFIEAGVYALRSLDADQDGHLDLLLLIENASGLTEIWVLPGNGDASFGAAIRSPSGMRYLTSDANLVVGDFNGDGAPDVAMASARASESIEFRMVTSLGDGTGSYVFTGDARLAFWPRALSTGDVNQDGRDDLLALHQYEERVDDEAGTRSFFIPDLTSVSVLFCTREGGPGPAVTSAFDLEHDPILFRAERGKDEIPVSLVVTDSRGLVLQIGVSKDGELGRPRAFSSASGSHSRCWVAGLADTNGDGRQDVFAQTYRREFVVRFGSEDGGFGTGWLAPPISTALPIYATDLAGPADFDNDGHLDLVFFSGEGVGVAFGDGCGAFSTFVLLVHEYGWSTATTGDFNGDGLADILIGTEYLRDQERTLQLYLNDGERDFLQAAPSAMPTDGPEDALQTTDRDVLGLRAGDVNRDGIDDALVCEADEAFILLGQATGSFARGHALSLLGSSVSQDEDPLHVSLHTPQLVDITGDAILDILGVATKRMEDRTIIWVGNDSGSFLLVAEIPCRDVFDWPHDLDADGYLDLVALGSWDAELGTFALHGEASGWMRAEPLAVEPWMGATAQLIGDLDGDGIPDFGEAWGSVLWIYLGTSGGGRGPRLQFCPNARGVFSQNISTPPSDYNGDGKLDIALAADQEIVIVLNAFGDTRQGEKK